MSIKAKLGYGFIPRDARHGIDTIKRAEQAGFDTAWTVMPALGRDTPTLFAAAAVQTERIRLGTAIVPAFTRHPLGLATQMLTLEDLAPGRIRLGIGTAHQRLMIPAFGLPFERPLAQLREYVQILRSILQTGSATFAGEFYRVNAKIDRPTGTPVLISTLREHAFETAGELADGAITWLCPIEYVERIAKPALQRGARAAGQAPPPLVAHALIVPGHDRAAGLAAARKMVMEYSGAVFYKRMFADAGFAWEEQGPPPELIESLLIGGDAAEIAAGVRDRLARGADELLLSIPLSDHVGDDERELFGIVAGL